MAAPDLSIMLEFFKSDPARSPAKKDVDVQKLDSLEIEDYRSRATRITWFGHSAFLLEMPRSSESFGPHAGRNTLTSPMAWKLTLQVAVCRFPLTNFRRLMLCSSRTIITTTSTTQPSKRLRTRVRMFYVPLGLDNHLIRWGVEPARIQAGDWWESFDFEGITFTAAPARHFSGRGITDRNSTLWCSWIIEGKKDEIYLQVVMAVMVRTLRRSESSMDHLTWPCWNAAQYNLAWQDIHMMPEETVQAGIDVRAKWMIPIHWGAFTLSLHSWTDPIERASAKAKRIGS